MKTDSHYFFYIFDYILNYEIMKNFIFLISIFSVFALFSCKSGSETDKKDGNPEFCDCVKESKKDSPDNELIKKCDELYSPKEDATEEDIEKYMDQVSNCK